MCNKNPIGLIRISLSRFNQTPAWPAALQRLMTVVLPNYPQLRFWLGLFAAVASSFDVYPLARCNICNPFIFNWRLYQEQCLDAHLGGKIKNGIDFLSGTSQARFGYMKGAGFQWNLHRRGPITGILHVSCGCKLASRATCTFTTLHCCDSRGNLRPNRPLPTALGLLSTSSIQNPKLVAPWDNPLQYR